MIQRKAGLRFSCSVAGRRPVMMMTDIVERRLLGGGLLVLAASLTALGSALGVVGLAHMANAANLCGPTSGHCVACFGAVASLAAAVVVGVRGVSLFQPVRAAQTAR